MQVTQEVIDRVLMSQATLRSWRNKHNSTEWLEANAVNRALFSDTFSKAHNCGCVEDFFILLNLKLKKQSISEIMDRKFVLKKGKVVMSHGCDIVTENSSDDQCIALLRVNKKHASKFERLPENWEEIVDEKIEVKPKKTRAKRTKKEVVETETKANESTAEKEEVQEKID